MDIVFSDNSIKIYRYCLRGLNSNMYMMIGERQPVIVIDPCVCKEAIDIINDNGIDNIIIIPTHEHFDHISGINYFRDAFAGKGTVNVICNSACAENIKFPEKNLAFYWDILIAGLDEEDRKFADEIKDISYSCYADLVFTDKYDFEWNGEKIIIISAPGHAPGGVIIYYGEQVVFTGDNLTNGNGVICRWPGGSKEEYNAITKPMIEKIPVSAIICPGHGVCGNIEELREYMQMFKRKN